MATPRRRRYPAAVYRRRRLVVLLCALLIAIGIWALIAQPWARAAVGPTTPALAPSPSPSVIESVSPVSELIAAGTASATPQASAAPQATPAAPAAPEPCNVADIVVEPLTNQDSYAADQLPELSMQVTNSGEVPCTIDVGTRSQKFTVTSGRDTWWRSTDCQAEPTEQKVTLEAGRTVTSVAPVIWNRTRSSVATCGKSDRPVAPAGGSSYHLQVEIAGIASEGSRQFLLY